MSKLLFLCVFVLCVSLVIYWSMHRPAPPPPIRHNEAGLEIIEWPPEGPDSASTISWGWGGGGQNSTGQPYMEFLNDSYDYDVVHDSRFAARDVLVLRRGAGQQTVVEPGTLVVLVDDQGGVSAFTRVEGTRKVAIHGGVHHALPDFIESFKKFYVPKDQYDCSTTPCAVLKCAGDKPDPKCRFLRAKRK